jgi:cobalt-zinc-cadmium efflux system outer membrane protein
VCARLVAARQSSSAEKIMFRFIGRAARNLVLCTLSITAAAQQPVAPDTPLTLRAALEQALARNPQLQGFVFRLRAQEARAATASLRPPWELRAELENVAGTGELSATEAAEATFSLSRIIELGDKRTRRIEAADAARELMETERAAAQLDVAAEVARRFIHVASDQEQLLLTRRATELAQETLDSARLRVQSARAPEVELNRARIAFARAQIEQEHAEHELAASRRKLAAMWGDTDDRFGRIETDLFLLPPLPTFQQLAEAIPGSIDLARFASEARLRDAELRIAEGRTRSDITVSAGVRHLQTADDQALVIGATLPLGARSRAASAIAEARAQRELTDAERETHRVRVLAQLFEVYQELSHAVTEANTLRESVAPEMEAALKSTQYAFERGRYSYLEWTEAQRELIAVRRSLIEAAANAHLFQVEIERLTRTELP